MKVYKGTVITCDEKNTVANYLAEDGGKILFVGDELPEEYKDLKPSSSEARRLSPLLRTPISISRATPPSTPGST